METVLQTDVVVLGGGSAGVAAAVAAARKGLQVMLIERNSYLGGKATTAEVGTICGLYHFSKNEKSEYIVKGFTKEFAEELRVQSNTSPLFSPEGVHYLPYQVEAFKEICLNLINEHKIGIYFNAVLEHVTVEDQQLKSVHIIAAGNPVTINLHALIDCSGDSVISQAANLPLIKSENYQAAAQVFTMQGVAEENEFKLGMIMMKALRSAIDNNILGDFYDRVYVVQGSLKNNCVNLKIGIPLAVTYAPGNLQELRTVALGFVENLSQFLIKQVDAFKNASLVHIAPEIGIRTGQRSTGKYLLTEEDVLSCKKFDNAIANASWPVEIWEQNRRVNIHYFTLDDYYQVPAGCLHSNTIGNLFFAGRNISATDGAIASARVMGICLQTGYAAGCMAAASALDLPIGDTIRQIQNEQL
ncbi:MAG: FAD-dependent oxidoreductase [Chitinophagaceae bacterium]|nr:FAD-dependent oxidoreductase [Chitinophagaceae bacterium]